MSTHPTDTAKQKFSTALAVLGLAQPLNPPSSSAGTNKGAGEDSRDADPRDAAASQNLPGTQPGCDIQRNSEQLYPLFTASLKFK